MCWKCFLCCCTCGSDDEQAAKSRSIDLAIEKEKELRGTKGYLVPQDKNWIPKILPSETIFAHGSDKASPNEIIDAGGFDPKFASEICSVVGQVPKKYFLAFPVSEIPENMKRVKPPAQQLWGDFKYVYFFKMPALTQVFQASTPTTGATFLVQPMETGFDTLVPWDNVVMVFQRVKDDYVVNPIDKRLPLPNQPDQVQGITT